MAGSNSFVNKALKAMFVKVSLLVRVVVSNSGKGHFSRNSSQGLTPEKIETVPGRDHLRISRENRSLPLWLVHGKISNLAEHA